MNKVLLNEISNLTEKYQKALLNFDSLNDEFALFNFEYRYYYKPFSDNILPEMIKSFKANPNDNFKIYEHLILPKYTQALFEEIIENKQINSFFLQRLSESITNDFNKLLVAYSKMNEELKDNFIKQFANNKKSGLLMMADVNPELAIKTIANLCCPRLQFHLINNADVQITNKIAFFLNTYCWEHVMKILTEYCFYPQSIEPKTYLLQWEGEPFIHIKFCRKIMGNRYEKSKSFLKNQNNLPNI